MKSLILLLVASTSARAAFVAPKLAVAPMPVAPHLAPGVSALVPHAIGLVLPTTLLQAAATPKGPAGTPAVEASPIAELTSIARQAAASDEGAAPSDAGAPFDGADTKRGEGTPTIDMANAVRPEQRLLLEAALAQQPDALEAFFSLKGGAMPGYVQIIEATDDSPGAATVVTRVVYKARPSASRVSEEMQLPFWMAVDLETNKLEFFSRSPFEPKPSMKHPSAGVVSSAAQWNALWREIGDDAPVVDFSRDIVVLANAGMKSNGGYRVVFEEPVRRRDGVIVRYRVEAPRGMAPSVMRRAFGYMTLPITTGPISIEQAR